MLVVAVDVAPLWLWGSSSPRDFDRSCRFCDGAFLFSSVNFAPDLSVVSLKLLVAVDRGDGLGLLNGILRSCCDGSQVFHVRAASVSAQRGHPPSKVQIDIVDRGQVDLDTSTMAHSG